MKMSIQTVRFQELVAKSAKGASENKLLPITSLMALELKDGVLTLTTTDSSNTLKVIADKVEGDNMYVVVPVELFSKLVARTTSDNITLTVTENSLEVRGNGKYNIPLPMDEDGVVRFPEYVFEKIGDPETVQLTTIKNILAINKSAVGRNIDTPYLCGYYCGDMVLTTDELVLCLNDIKLVKDPIFVYPEMMELLALNNVENINFYRNDNFFLFETPTMVLHGVEHDGKDMFPVEDVMGFLDEEFSSSCKVPKILLQSVIDRLSLFIEPYDKNGAYLTFTKDGVKVTSKKSSSVEIINYVESTNFQNYVCCVDIPQFKTQIDTIPGDTIHLWYGHDVAIKLTADKVTQVIALLDDENLEANSGTAD